MEGNDVEEYAAGIAPSEAALSGGVGRGMLGGAVGALDRSGDGICLIERLCTRLADVSDVLDMSEVAPPLFVLVRVILTSDSVSDLQSRDIVDDVLLSVSTLPRRDKVDTFDW